MKRDTTNFANVNFTFKGIETGGISWNQDIKRGSLIYTVTPIDQHAFEDGVPDVHEVTVLLSNAIFN